MSEDSEAYTLTRLEVEDPRRRRRTRRIRRRVKGALELACIKVATAFRRIMDLASVSKVLQSVLPAFLLALAASIPAAIQTFFYLCCLLSYFTILVWPNVSQHCAKTARRCLHLWTTLLVFSFTFLTSEIIAQVVVSVEVQGSERDTIKVVLKILGLDNLKASRLLLALAKHFLVLFVSSWQRGVFLGMLDEENQSHRYSDLVEMQRCSLKFAERIAIHFWSLVLLSICLIKITPLNLPYVLYLTAYSFYTGRRPYGGGRGMIKGIKIGYLIYSTLHYVFLIGIRISAHFSPGVVDLAKKLRLSFLCDAHSLGITSLYMGDLTLSLLLGLYEFSIKKYPDRELGGGEGLNESLLPREQVIENGDDEDSKEETVNVDPYPFHWCTALVVTLYSLLLSKMIGFFLLVTGLLALMMPREKVDLYKRCIFASAIYMSCLWLAVYLIVSSNTCSKHMNGLGLCDSRSTDVNRWFETHLLAILPIFSILVMKQTRIYYAKDAKSHWVHKVYDRCNGFIHLVLGSASFIFVPLAWICLATFCQPHNDVLHSMYIVILVLHLVFRIDVVSYSGIIASFHMLVIFLTKEMFFDEKVLNLKCTGDSLLAILNSCILSDGKYKLDMLLLLFLVLSTSVDKDSIEEKRQQVEMFFQVIVEVLKKIYEDSKRVCISLFGETLGWTLTLLVIMLLVHLENLKGMKNSLIQVLWTGICILNLTFSNFSGSKSYRGKSVFWSAIPVFAVIHLLCQFIYASFYTFIYKLLPNAKKTTHFIENDVGLSRDTNAWHLIISIGEPIAIMLLLQLYRNCNRASNEEIMLESKPFKFMRRLAVVHLDKVLAFTIFLFVVHLNTVLGTMILLCFLISLHIKPFGYHALCLLKTCEVLTCLTLVAAEALYVPCISKLTNLHIMKLINFVCCGDQRDYFVTSWLSLAVLSLSKITIQQRKSNSLNEFVTVWPSALSACSEKSELCNGGDQKERKEKKDGEDAKKPLKWGKFKKQIWYLAEATPFYLERLFFNHGSGLCSFVFLLCAFYAKNIISIVYVCFIILTQKHIDKKSWMIISIICSAIALYQDILSILEAHKILSVTGISSKWVYWLSLNPTEHLIWTCMIAAFFSSLKFRYDRYMEVEDVENADTASSSVKFFDHPFWGEVSFFERKNWTTLEFFIYGFFRYSQDISLVFVVSLAFYDKDAIHLGYLFVSLYFFRKREALRKRRNKHWKVMVGFNLTIIALNILYQAPVFHSTSKKNTCNVQNLIGLYKITGLIGNSIHYISMRPITSILLFVVLQIQSYIFDSKIHIAVTQCGLDFREHKQNFNIKRRHQFMLLKKFQVQQAYKSNESRKQRLKWLRANVLQIESKIKEPNEGGRVTSGSVSEEVPESEGGTFEAEGKVAQRKTSHIRSPSDLPDTMFLHTSYSNRAERFGQAAAEDSTNLLSEPEADSPAKEDSGQNQTDTVDLEKTPEKDESKVGEESPGKITVEDTEDESSPDVLIATFWQKLFFPNRIDSHNIFCYFFMCIFFISEFSFMSMVYPVLIFYYALLVKSPSKTFWKFALAGIEFWLLAQYIWQIPIYNSGISPDDNSICVWVAETTLLSSVKIIGLHESATRCFPGFLLYLSCLFHFFSLESRLENIEEESNTKSKYSGFSLLQRQAKLFYLKVCTYHEEFPSFMHIKVKGKLPTLKEISKVELGMGLTAFLKGKMIELSYTTCTPHLKVLEVETDESNDTAVILAVVDCRFDFDSFDGLLIHPGRTIAQLLRQFSGEKIFVPHGSSAVTKSKSNDADIEVMEAPKPEVTIEDCFAAHEDKPDLYVATVFMDLFAYIFVLCLYQAAVSSNKSLSESLNESIFPADYIVTILGLFLFLVADRAVYVIASNRARAILHYISVPAYFAGGMLMYWQRAPDHPSYTCIFMFVKCISLGLQSWQLQTGYPKSTSGNLLLRHYSMSSWLAVSAYTAIPFLYELRCLLDWTCTATTLTLFDWLTFEEIRLKLYNNEIVRIFKSRRKFGHSQPKHVKFFQGLLLFILLLIILWTPLLVFSSGSPSFQVPILKGLDMNVTLLTGDVSLKQPWTRPSERMPLFTGGNNRLITEAEVSPKLISKYFYYQQIQCLSVAPASNQLWMASEPSKASFASALVSDSRKAYISVSWSMIRDHPVTASMCASTIFAQLDGSTRINLSHALNQSSPVNSTDVKIPLKLLDPKTKEKVPGLYRLYWQLNGSPCTVVDKVAVLRGNDPWVNCSLVLHTEIDKKEGYAFKSQWWDVECELPKEDNKTDTCWQKSNKSSNGSNGPLLKAILQEVQSGVIGTFLSSKGITGLYITFVFLIGRGVRAMVANRVLGIPHVTMPSIMKLRTLCDDVRDARTVFDLELEELLYKALIRIYRSSELLIKMSKKLD